MICCEQGTSPPRVKKIFQFLSKVSQNLRDIPAPGESHWSAVQLKYRGNSIRLIQRSVISRRSLCPREQPWEASQLGGGSLPLSQSAWQGELKGSSLSLSELQDKRFASGRLAYIGKGVHDTPCALIFLHRILKKPPAIYALMHNQGSKLMCIDVLCVMVPLYVS